MSTWSLTSSQFPFSGTGWVHVGIAWDISSPSGVGYWAKDRLSSVSRGFFAAPFAGDFVRGFLPWLEAAGLFALRFAVEAPPGLGFGVNVDVGVTDLALVVPFGGGDGASVGANVGL